jgi:hypothetical protein
VGLMPRLHESAKKPVNMQQLPLPTHFNLEYWAAYFSETSLSGQNFTRCHNPEVRSLTKLIIGIFPPFTNAVRGENGEVVSVFN